MNRGRPQAVVIGAAMALAGAVTGFFTGTRPAGPPHWPSPAASSSAGRAPSYEELRSMRRGLNADLYQNRVDSLAGGAPALFDPVEQSEKDKDQVLALRARRRAYDGAPPAVPHAVIQMDVVDCVACHEKGAQLAGRTAPRPSHDFHDSCLQCHVLDRDPRPQAPAIELPVNTFIGLASPHRGERAWPGAPPTIPHPTLMRSKCDSCHGTVGRRGIRSTHPWRESCTQCHTPSAALDQQPTQNQREGI